MRRFFSGKVPPNASGSYSLRKRLIAAILGISVFIWMVSLSIIVTVAWRETSDVFDDALKEGARLALVLGANLQSQGALTGAQPREGGEPTKLKIYYQIVADDGRVLQRAERAPSRPFSDQLTASNRYLNVWVDGDLWRVYVLRVPDQPFQVQIGQEWDERTEMLDEMAKNLAWPALLLLCVLGVFCWWAIRKLLAPIDLTAQRIAAKSAQDLSAVSVQREPQELQPIVLAFNGVLARLHRALQGERRFTADAAHELRTPLAALRMRIQLMQRQQAEAPQNRLGTVHLAGGLQVLRNEVDRCTALVESLLLLARLDPQQPDQLVKETVDLEAEFSAVVAATNHPSQRLEVDCQVIAVQAQPVLLRSALRNLVDNALRYGAPNGRVRLEAFSVGDSVRLAVRDDGPGVSAADRARLTERFFRVLGSGQTGSGLGLSIVEKIAALHGARLQFEAGIDGAGLGVILDFPPT
jgi:two-component system sensor histidine kinase QseC